MKKNITKPLISVIIPFYKKKKYFKRCLNSVLSQSYKNYEIIIIFDDNDKQDLIFLKKIKRKSKKILLIENKKNTGAGPARNLGINTSRGDFIAFLDSDDEWKKNKLKIQLDFMLKKNVLFTHTDYEIVLKNKKKKIRKAKVLDFNQLLKSCDIGLSTVMIKKKTLFKKKNFPSLKTKEDYVLWLKILKKRTKFIYPINRTLTLWHDVENSLSKNVMQKIFDGFKVYKQFMGYNYLISFLKLIILSISYLWKKIY